MQLQRQSSPLPFQRLSARDAPGTNLIPGRSPMAWGSCSFGGPQQNAMAGVVEKVLVAQVQRLSALLRCCGLHQRTQAHRSCPGQWQGSNRRAGARRGAHRGLRSYQTMGWGRERRVPKSAATTPRVVLASMRRWSTLRQAPQCIVPDTAPEAAPHLHLPLPCTLSLRRRRCPSASHPLVPSLSLAYPCLPTPGGGGGQPSGRIPAPPKKQIGSPLTAPP